MILQTKYSLILADNMLFQDRYVYTCINSVFELRRFRRDKYNANKK